jgi:hypothetical protein
MIAAATYLLSTQPIENDPCESAHQASLLGLNMATAALLLETNHKKEKAVEPWLANYSPKGKFIVMSPL